MRLFDTHCHLNFAVFNQTVPQVIERARQAGVERMMVVGTTLDNSRGAVELAQQFGPGLSAAVGVHPHKAFAYLEGKNLGRKMGRGKEGTSFSQQVQKIVGEVRQTLEELVTHPEVKAIGEIGFDRWVYTKTTHQLYQVTPQFIELQRALFFDQLDLALACNKPVIIHNRQASEDLLQALYPWMNRDKNHRLFLQHQAVFHCCEPDQSLLKFAIEHDFFMGVAGDVTFDPLKQHFVKQIPIENLVLETDAPFFKPRSESTQQASQAKGNPCEPSELIKIAQNISKIKQIKLEKLVAQTTLNAGQLFGFDN